MTSSSTTVKRSQKWLLPERSVNGKMTTEHMSTVRRVSTERVSTEHVSTALHMSTERVSMRGRMSTRGHVSTQGRVNTTVNPTQRIPSRLATLPWPPREHPQYG